MSPFFAILGPDCIDIGPADLRPVPAGACVDDLLPADTPRRERYLCVVAGPGIAPHTYVPREQWHALPADGQVLVFHRPIMGGREGAGRLLVAFAAAAVAQNYGPALGLLFSFGGNALLTLANRPEAQQVAPSSPTYAFQGPGNVARVDQPIPELFGHQNVYPDLASQPYYTYTENGDQLYHAVFLVSEGELEILQLRLENSLILQHGSPAARGQFMRADIARVGQGWDR